MSANKFVLKGSGVEVDYTIGASFAIPALVYTDGAFQKKCPSSDNLRLVRRFEKGGSGSSGLEFKRPAADAASGGLRWLYA